MFRKDFRSTKKCAWFALLSARFARAKHLIMKFKYPCSDNRNWNLHHLFEKKSPNLILRSQKLKPFSTPTIQNLRQLDVSKVYWVSWKVEHFSARIKWHSTRYWNELPIVKLAQQTGNAFCKILLVKIASVFHNIFYSSKPNECQLMPVECSEKIFPKINFHLPWTIGWISLATSSVFISKNSLQEKENDLSWKLYNFHFISFRKHS